MLTKRAPFFSFEIQEKEMAAVDYMGVYVLAAMLVATWLILR